MRNLACMGKKGRAKNEARDDEIDRILCDLEIRADATLVEELAQSGKKKSGRPAKASMMEIMRGLIWHALSEVGTAGEHFEQATGKKLAESSLSERRRNIPWEKFQQITKLFLAPLAEEKKHPEAFYKGFRLVGIDGSAFSLRNTVTILSRCTKVVSRRLAAAFAKIRGSVLVELGVHNPIGCAIGSRQESEAELSNRLLPQVPKKSLVAGDRYYGCGKFILAFLKICIGSLFLFRVKDNLRARVVKRLSDGSRIVRVEVRDEKKRSRVVATLEIREIRATLKRKGHRAQRIRLWTNFLSEKDAPASELVELYARRWEHETYFRELKCVLGTGSLLDSQSVDSACQEIAALLIASSIVAEHRIAASDPKNGLKVTAIGFAHALYNVRVLWEVVPMLREYLTAHQLREFATNMRDKMRPDKVPKKRSRSCPRAVRQPIKSWPRLLKNSYTFGETKIQIV